MKLDMGHAWNDATTLLKANFALIAAILGLYYFLPSFAITLLFPGVMNPTPPEIPQGADPEVVLEMFSAFFQEQYATGWPFFVLVTLTQYVGTVSVLALFSESPGAGAQGAKGGPTVGDALKAGLRGTPSYLATQLLFILGAGLVFGLIGGVLIALVPILGVLAIMVMAVGLVYVMIKLTLVPAVIGMEGELNPIKAMKRSWALSKGNSILIFVFLFVLFITLGLIALLATLLSTAIFAVFGGTIAQIGGGFVDSLVNAATGGIILIVLAAIKRQLTSPGTPPDVEVFD